MCVCVSAREHISESASLHVQPSPIKKFVHGVPIAVVRSTSDGVVIRYLHALPDLWVTSCLHTIARDKRREKGVYSK